MTRPINIELFSCSGGMAEGFRRAGVEFDFVFDYDEDACHSYAANLRHFPVRMDVRDLVRMCCGGWSPGDVGLLVADPPCTPWSRAGKRLGTEDERDMLEETAELITLLKPRAYLIGNVPGLQDSTSWHVVQRVIGGLQKHGYCVADYAVLDAADYGVPQHRVRPFWYGHREGPCVRWPAPTHGDASHPSLPGLALKPWVTCRAALSHLPVEQLGRPVRLKKRDFSAEHGRTWDNHPPSQPDEPSMTIKCNGGRNAGAGAAMVIGNPRHAPAPPDEPAATIGAKDRGQSTVLVVDREPDRHRVPESGDTPSRTIVTTSGITHLIDAPEMTHTHSIRGDADAPAGTVVCEGRDGGASGTVMRTGDWPWDRPATTIHEDPRIAPPGHHDSSILSPSEAKGTRKRGSSQPFSLRTRSPDRPSATVTTKDDRPRNGSPTLDWPWNRPSTTVCAGVDKIAPAGEHAAQFGPNAIVLSERAAAILQGVPESWTFHGKTKKARWAQLGMAMPPALAEAVARSIRAAMEQEKAA